MKVMASRQHYQGFAGPRKVFLTTVDAIKSQQGRLPQGASRLLDTQ
ncbi:hypothetical protein [Sporisorium scitamineum]|uniref:Uncharacterized protein n=1 Tax=Sporisorium scitamineum TaxID=49012 RepID=A0A0F7RZU7_9BASI|nr:hypothetical protein [Sporisorium scitamineum]